MDRYIIKEGRSTYLNFQSVSPSNWSVRIKQEPFFSVVRTNTISAGTYCRFETQEGVFSILQSFNTNEYDHIYNNYCNYIDMITLWSVSTTIKWPTLISELGSSFNPLWVILLYFRLFASLSRRKRLKSSKASFKMVTVNTNARGEMYVNRKPIGKEDNIRMEM